MKEQSELRNSETDVCKFYYSSCCVLLKLDSWYAQPEFPYITQEKFTDIFEFKS